MLFTHTVVVVAVVLGVLVVVVVLLLLVVVLLLLVVVGGAWGCWLWFYVIVSATAVRLHGEHRPSVPLQEDVIVSPCEGQGGSMGGRRCFTTRGLKADGAPPASRSGRVCDMSPCIPLRLCHPAVLPTPAIPLCLRGYVCARVGGWHDDSHAPPPAYHGVCGYVYAGVGGWVCSQA
jgi:hypothetical protein